MNYRSQVSNAVQVSSACDFGLKLPPKTLHVFILSVIAGADNRQMIVRIRQMSADLR